MTRILKEAFADYCDKRLALGSDSTTLQFEINLRRFADYLGRSPTTDDLTDDQVQRVMVSMIKNDGLAARTANKFRDNMLALWRFLCRRGELTRWPEVMPLVEPKRDPLAWSKEQLRQLFLACDKQKGTIGVVPARLFWHGLHATMWDVAERISGLLSLRCHDVDCDGGWVTVRAEGRKGKSADKTSRIHRDTALILREIIRLQTREKIDTVFLWPFNRWVLTGCGVGRESG